MGWPFQLSLCISGQQRISGSAVVYSKDRGRRSDHDKRHRICAGTASDPWIEGDECIPYHILYAEPDRRYHPRLHLAASFKWYPD